MFNGTEHGRPACWALRELVDGPHVAWVETADGLLRPGMQPTAQQTGADWQAAIRWRTFVICACILCLSQLSGAAAWDQHQHRRPNNLRSFRSLAACGLLCCVTYRSKPEQADLL